MCELKEREREREREKMGFIKKKEFQYFINKYHHYYK